MKIVSGLAEGQILQRRGRAGASFRIHGTTSARGPVVARISGPGGPLKGWARRKVGLSDGEEFDAAFNGVPPGGPYRMELLCGGLRTARRFYVGDVWLLAGQSNMQGTADMTGPAAPHPLVRCYSMRHVWRKATDPLHILAESRDECHNDGLQCPEAQCERQRCADVKGVGVGIFFARELLERSGVPQGLIPAAHGATSLAQWSPKAKGQFYESMLRAVRSTGQPLAGVLWYQGESDGTAATVAAYTRGMKQLVAATRRDLRLPRLPWVVGQLARSHEPGRDGEAWNQIQEQQRLLPDHIKYLETVATVDLPMDDAVHLGSAAFPRLAKRMAEAAAKLVLKRTARPLPRLRSIVPPGLPVDSKGHAVTRPYVEVVFDHVSGGLRAGGEPCGFSLLDSHGQPLPRIFKTTLHGNRARLHADWEALREARPMLAYGHGATPVCNITDGRDGSLPVFTARPVFKPAAFLPFVTQWYSTGVVAAGPSLAEVQWCEFAVLPALLKKYSDGFVNEHLDWRGKQGRAYFNTRIELPEPMRLQFLMGYDGPFRLWLDERPFFTDLQGTNPCPPDKSAKTVSLSAGAHRITIGMDLHCGQAWGFWLRFRRRDVSAAALKANGYSKPVYK